MNCVSRWNLSWGMALKGSLRPSGRSHNMQDDKCFKLNNTESNNNTRMSTLQICMCGIRMATDSWGKFLQLKLKYKRIIFSFPSLLSNSSHVLLAFPQIHDLWPFLSLILTIYIFPKFIAKHNYNHLVNVRFLVCIDFRADSVILDNQLGTSFLGKTDSQHSFVARRFIFARVGVLWDGPLAC